jgi:hypothetical protein
VGGSKTLPARRATRRRNRTVIFRPHTRRGRQ